MAETAITPAPVSVAVGIASATRDRFTADQTFCEPALRTILKTNDGSDSDVG
jgi:hypothetical protein